MIRLALVEDEQDCAAQITDYIGRYNQEHNTDIVVTVFQDGEDITENYTGKFEMILMDIQMRFMDGMTAAKEIRKRDQEVEIVFITNMASYAVMGYEVEALDYILKPVSYPIFKEKLTRAIERIRKSFRKNILINMQDGVRKQDINRIWYIESQSHRMTYHTMDGVFISSTRKMEELEREMESCGFFRSNKGYLVNMRLVSGISDGCCLIGGDSLPISRRKKTEFMELLAKYL